MSPRADYMCYALRQYGYFSTVLIVIAVSTANTLLAWQV